MTPDGARILTGSDDNTARIWDAKSGAELVELKGHGFPVTSLAVTPDGARVVTASRNGAAWIGELFPTGQSLIDQAKTIAPRCLTAAQREQFHLAPAQPHWCDAKPINATTAQ